MFRSAMRHRNPDLDPLLFAEGDLRAGLEAQVRKMLEAIEQYDGNSVLNTPQQDLVDYFVALGTVEAPALLEENASVDQQEAKLDMSHDFRYGSRFDDGPILVAGTAYSLHVPFAGDPTVFRCGASGFSMNPPRARVEGQEVVITHRAVQGESGEAVNRALRGVLASIQECLTWAKNDIEKHNAAVQQRATQALETRKKRLLENQDTVAAVGFPLRQRSDAPRTYAVPSVRRKIVPAPPLASTAPFVPEPALDEGTYEQILTILSNMVQVMERSPGAFAGLNEKDIRTHFLVQLNGQYEGAATGETFHGSGSTDILLPDKGKNVFIAECKFWDGPATISACIEQLLDYATWRDAKTAILIFNRRKDFSAVLEQIPRAVATHSKVKGSIKKLSETVFRFRVQLRDDASREMTVALMAFDIPADRSLSGRLKKPRKKNGS